MKGLKRVLKLAPDVASGKFKELHLSDFDILKPPLGKGAFGEVFKARYKKTGNYYAVKFIRRKSICYSKKMIIQANLETEIMYKVKHPYILKMHTHFETFKGVYLVLDFCSKGELYKIFLREQRRFNEKRVFKYIF
jgi:serine/threonine protein kinase